MQVGTLDIILLKNKKWLYRINKIYRFIEKVDMLDFSYGFDYKEKEDVKTIQL